MNSRERVIGSLDRKGYDRIPVKHEGTPEVNQMLLEHFGLQNMEQLWRVLGDDFRYAEPVYVGPPRRTFPRPPPARPRRHARSPTGLVARRSPTSSPGKSGTTRAPR
ncbi:MAG: hypothetical protein HGA66_14765 [Holophaga sp.]|nr:hypothetical protein [Holophaga sp.]